MSEKIIEIKKLPSGSTVITTETASGAIGIELGTGTIFVDVQDLYDFIRLLKEVDRHFIKKR